MSMRLKHFATGLMALFLGLVLTGCAGLSTKSTADITCTTKDINAMLQSGDYRKKVDNFLIIQDASSSMSEKLGKPFTYEPSKLVLSKDLINCLNNTLPDDFDVNAGMRLFGPVYSEKGLVYGMKKYAKADLENAVKGVGGTGGVTPVANAIAYAGDDLADMPGNAAVILFSDGINTQPQSPVTTAAALKDRYGENICIYTVLLGNDPKGKTLMEQIAAAGGCGFATEANNLHARTLSDGAVVGAADGMADFVTAVFLETAPPKPAPPMKTDLDSDGDGVTDSLDQCPDTPKGIKVDRVGCPVPIPEKVSITLLVEFDFDKALVKPRYHGDLEKVANFLKAYPDTNGELEGHTDSIGTDAYNMKLSMRRAESVKKYLVEKFNIDASRLTTAGYGESRPVATNETAEGRQRNRRVVANIVTMVIK